MQQHVVLVNIAVNQSITISNELLNAEEEKCTIINGR